MAAPDAGKHKGPLDVVIVYAFDCTTASPHWNKVNEIYWLVEKKLAKFRGSCLGYVYVELKFNRYTTGRKLVVFQKPDESTTGCTKNMASGLPEAHRLISLSTVNPNGVILLFSDGSPNNKGDFFDKAEEYVSTVPVHTFTLGSAAYNQGLSTIAANSPGGSFNSIPIPDKPDESSPLSQRLDGILLNSATSDNEKAVQCPVTKIGSWGGSEGSPMDITEVPRRLESITVNTGWVLDSIAFSYVDYTGQKRSAGRWGGPGGYGPHTIQLGESEFITQVSGTVGEHDGQTVISSIEFVTNLNNTYGPWGEARDNPTPFTIPVQPGSAIVGFFARAGNFINAIGVHVRPL